MEFLIQFLRPMGALIVFCILAPLIGGAIIYNGFEKMKLPKVSYARCALVYYSASFTAYLLLIPLPRLVSADWLLPAQWAVILGTQLLMIPILLKVFTRHALIVEVIAIAVTNVLAFVLVRLLFMGGSAA